MIQSTIMPLRKLRLTDASFTNPRTHTGLAPDDIRELALDILHRGLLVPLLVTADGLVIAGQRRYRALELLTRWREDPDVGSYYELQYPARSTSGGPLPASFVESLDARIHELVTEVPVRIVWTDDGESVTSRSPLALEGTALADNLLRLDLSSYEIAARLAYLHGQGVTGIQLARLIGKSPSYVSHKLSAWRKAGPELLEAWRDGMAEDAVEELGKLSLDAQAKALAGPVPRGRRGPAHRPSVDAVRDFLFELEQKEFAPGQQAAIGREARDFAYHAGVVDALRWVTGQNASATFVKLAGGDS